MITCFMHWQTLLIQKRVQYQIDLHVKRLRTTLQQSQQQHQYEYLDRKCGVAHHASHIVSLAQTLRLFLALCKNLGAALQGNASPW